MESQTNAETNNQTKTFDLPFGYQDKSNESNLHQSVVMSKRPTAKDLFMDESNGSGIQFNLMLQGASITKFGDLTMPVPMTVLLSLNSVDREKLFREFLDFIAATKGQSEGKEIEVGKVKLSFGIEINGITYDTVTFGHLLNGYDESEIETTGATGWHRRCLVVAKEITKLSQSNGTQEHLGAVPIEAIEKLDFFDLVTLGDAEVTWRDSFRA